MKVFVVTVSIAHEGGWVVGVFSTRELAQNAIDALVGADRGDRQEIREVALDTALTFGSYINV